MMGWGGERDVRGGKMMGWRGERDVRGGGMMGWGGERDVKGGRSAVGGESKVQAQDVSVG
jgi:hypothetical protein